MECVCMYVCVCVSGKGTNMKTNYYARSIQRKKVFPISILDMKNKI